MVILLNKIPASKGFHSGGALGFGPDDKALRNWVMLLITSKHRTLQVFLVKYFA
jgi:hypothetical protein